jgi:hypothetical protein
MKMTRLERLRKYLAEAQNDPIGNEKYIEDLKLSIQYEERFEPKNIEVSAGFQLTES